MSANHNRSNYKMVLKLELLDLQKSETEQDKEDKLYDEEYSLIMDAWEMAYWERQSDDLLGPSCENAGCYVCQGVERYDPFDEFYYDPNGLLDDHPWCQ